MENEDEIIKRHYAKIGAKGGRAGKGESKAREGSADNLRKYWEDVKAGRRPPPARRGRPRKENAEVRPAVRKKLPVKQNSSIRTDCADDVLDPVDKRKYETKAPAPRSLGIAKFNAQAEKEAGKASRLPVKQEPEVGRNKPCPCGSGRKYKKCCG